MTAGELLHLSLPHRRTELVRGRLIVREPANGVLSGEDFLLGFACALADLW